jgi:hypothetical protein
MWFDSELPPDLGMIKGQSAIATTDASGWLSLDLDNVTGLAVGEFGFLVCYKLDGGDHRNSPTFCSKMEVTSMTGVTPLGPLTDYVRNPDWPAQVAMVNGVQKFTGLLAVFDHDSNFVALQASGDYTVNWGDGGGDFNVTGGVQAERNISYASVGGTIVGTSKAVAVTFTDAGDTVNRTAHGYQNGQRVNFASIVSTTGISTHTTYFVVGRTANTFQVASTLGGSALALTTDGSGMVYIPEYKVALVTVTPQAGQNLTDFTLQKKHSSLGASPNPSPQWIDIAVNSSFLTTLSISFNPQTLPLLTEASIGENAVSNMNSLFTYAYSLQKVNLNTSAATSFVETFLNCTSLRSVQLFDTSSATTFANMFANCYSLQAVPLFDFSIGTDLSSVFSNCNKLQSVPLFDTSSALTLYAFLSSSGLRSVPRFNTSACLNFSGLLVNTDIAECPVFDTSAGTNFSQMFGGCGFLITGPAIDTSSGTDFSLMFNSCTMLRSVPDYDTSAGTLFNRMFYGCRSLLAAPNFDLSLATTINGMFNGCSSLRHLPPIYAPVCTDAGFLLTSCSGLMTLGVIYLPSVTSASFAFNGAASLQEMHLRGFTSTALNFSNVFTPSSLAKFIFEGVTKSFSVAYAKMSAAALDALYTSLGTASAQTITVTGNYGTTGDDPTIATSKGWTVTG